MPVAVVLIRREPHYRRAAVEDGLGRLGYVVTDRLANAAGHPLTRDDLLVMWNLKAGLDENQARLWEQRGGTVIVMENGYLAREEKTHYAISTHGHNGSGWFPVGTEDRFKRLGFHPRPQDGGRKGHLLICGQRGVGSALMRSPTGWGERTAGLLGGRLRPHPGNFVAKVPLHEDLAVARACVVWSSAAGVRALVEGLPVAYAAPHWICEDAAWHIDEIVGSVVPPMGDQAVRDALHRMAHGQWSVDEIAKGEPFARMRDERWGPRWV